MKEQAQLQILTLENNENMDVSADNNLFSEPTTKATTSMNCHSRTPNFTSHSTGQMLTPPLTVSAPTPIPLDPATKTAQIIAQIKERAYAKVHSSPEVTPLEFIDDLDDSDDDFLLPVLPIATKPARYDYYLAYLSDKEVIYIYLQLQRQLLGNSCVGRYIYQTHFSLSITKSFSDLFIVEFQFLFGTLKRITLEKATFASECYQGSHGKSEKDCLIRSFRYPSERKETC